MRLLRALRKRAPGSVCARHVGRANVRSPAGRPPHLTSPRPSRLGPPWLRADAECVCAGTSAGEGAAAVASAALPPRAPPHRSLAQRRPSDCRAAARSAASLARSRSIR
eukprot:599517-Prymnesium_polylepis.1